jgi:hypothetical protein
LTTLEEATILKLLFEQAQFVFQRLDRIQRFLLQSERRKKPNSKCIRIWLCIPLQRSPSTAKCKTGNDSGTRSKTYRE